MHITRAFSFEHHLALRKLVDTGITGHIFSLVAIEPLLESVMICS